MSGEPLLTESSDSQSAAPGDRNQAVNTAINPKMRFWDLQFVDKALEQEYQDSYFDTDVSKTRIGLVAGALVLLAFAIFEPYLLQTPPTVNHVRLLFVMPIILLSIIATYAIRDYLHPLLIGGSVMSTLSQIAMLPVLGPSTMTNTTMAYLQYILFITVLLFQPFRYLVIPVVGLAILMTFALREVAGSGTQVANYEMAIQSVSFIALLFAYLREHSQRQLFTAHVQVGLLRNETERQQANQINWLRNLSRYLEHELRNHVFIVESNLEFLQQDVAEDQRPFVHRALRSVSKLNDLCESVGEASTLESALQLDRPHPVNFSRMVTERVLERARDLDEANPLELDIDPDLWVNGSEQRFLQVFDHLLNNALEYSSEDAFVRIEVKSVAGSVYFTVHNRGEPLPEGRDIFAAFESTRPKTSLGMGLYVSYKIVEHHGGSIEARTQLGQTIVLVTLPQTDAPVSLVEQNLSQDPMNNPAKGSPSSRSERKSGKGPSARIMNIDKLMRKRPGGDSSRS